MNIQVNIQDPDQNIDFKGCFYRINTLRAKPS